MIRLLVSLGVYFIGFYAYGQVLDYVIGDESMITVGDRAIAVFAGLGWMGVLAFIFEIYTEKQGLRDDIVDIFERWLGKFRIPKISLPSINFPKRKPKNEIIPGVVRPTTILAEMIAVRVFANPEKLSVSGPRYEWVDHDLDIVIRFDWRLQESIHPVGFRLERRGSILKLDETEISKIHQACLKAQEQKGNSTATQNQLLAVDFIETLLQLEPSNPDKKVVNLRN